MKPLNKGDRVRLVGNTSYGNGDFHGKKGVVINIDKDNRRPGWDVRVEFDNRKGAYHWCSRKQLMKLVKEKRRRFWINIYPDGIRSVTYLNKKMADKWATPDRIECIKLVEVKK
jgi:hypothetical protein